MLSRHRITPAVGYQSFKSKSVQSLAPAKVRALMLILNIIMCQNTGCCVQQVRSSRNLKMEHTKVKTSFKETRERREVPVYGPLIEHHSIITCGKVA
jgi:hypothetical protein